MNENLGGLDEVNETEEKVVEIEKKRKPFHYWTVAGRDYKLKLQAGSVERVENKYHQNIINMIDEIPPLSVMLTIIQAAMENWEHNMSYTKIKKLYDTWTEEDSGDQFSLYTKVIIPTLVVSGFFPAEQVEDIMEEMK